MGLWGSVLNSAVDVKDTFKISLTHNFWKPPSFRIVPAWQLSSVWSVVFYNVLQTDWGPDMSDFTQTRIFKSIWLKRMFNENAYTDVPCSILLGKKMSNCIINLFAENTSLLTGSVRNPTLFLRQLLETSLIEYSLSLCLKKNPGLYFLHIHAHF